MLMPVIHIMRDGVLPRLFLIMHILGAICMHAARREIRIRYVIWLGYIRKIHRGFV